MSNGQKVYLDACCFIDMVKTQVKKTLEKDRELNVWHSVKSEFTRLLMSGQYVRLVQLTPFIAVDARDLRWTHGIALRGADSIHVASALAMQCEEFLSANGRLNKLNSVSVALAKLGLHVRSARETQCLPEKYKQLTLDDKAN